MLLSSKTKSHQLHNLSTDFRTVPPAKRQCQESDLHIDIRQHSDRDRVSDCNNDRGRDCDRDNDRTIITINGDGYPNSGEYNWFQYNFILRQHHQKHRVSYGRID